jgi:3-oxoacyl-[acyl-carrier protein] reductase
MSTLRGSLNLTDRVVLVTGGAGGIGGEVAIQAAAAGAAIAIADRATNEAAGSVVDQIRARGSVVEAFAGDLADAADAQRVVTAVEGRFGRIDGLVNCAAIMGHGDFLDLDLAAWEEMLRVDVLLVIHVCRAVLPGMLDRGSGAIVNFASRLAETGSAEAPHYAAAKAAVVSLTRSLAQTYGPRGVRVNAVAPGTTNTNMGRDVIDSPAGRERASRIPLRRFVTPAEVASTVVFLLSDAASGIVGQTIQVNGGELMT